MDELVLEGAPVLGVPDGVRVEVGQQRAVVVADPDDARELADLLVGLVDPPPGVTVSRPDRVRLVPPEGGLLPHLTVLGNLVHASCVTRSLVIGAAAEACRETASECGLDDVVNRYPHEITPGRRRLAGVARALCADATVIVLEDAPGLPTWGALLDLEHNTELLSVALLLITPGKDRTAGFTVAGIQNG